MTTLPVLTRDEVIRLTGLTPEDLFAAIDGLPDDADVVGLTPRCPVCHMPDYSPRAYCGVCGVSLTP